MKTGLEYWKDRAKRMETERDMAALDAIHLRRALKNLLPYLGTWVEDFDPSEDQSVAYHDAKMLVADRESVTL